MPRESRERERERELGMDSPHGNTNSHPVDREDKEGIIRNI
jgi:hypothetical protein